MRTRTILFSAALALGVAAAPLTSLAATATARDATTRLEQAERELAFKAASTKGGPQQDFLLEKRRVDDLIQALESGQVIDPREIDEAVERANMAP